MVEKYNIRTDLALEQKERFDTDHIEISGVIVKETYDEEKEIRITTVKIETENGARTMGKPVGTYITIEAPAMAVDDEEFHSEISEEIAKFLQQMIYQFACRACFRFYVVFRCKCLIAYMMVNAEGCLCIFIKWCGKSKTLGISAVQ